MGRMVFVVFSATFLTGCVLVVNVNTVFALVFAVAAAIGALFGAFQEYSSSRIDKKVQTLDEQVSEHEAKHHTKAKKHLTVVQQRYGAYRRREDL